MLPGFRHFAVRLATLVAVAAALTTPAVSLAATGVVADCAPPLPLEKAVFSDLVFVGRVTAVTDNGHAATVEVSEVWRGDVPSSISVLGGADPANPAEDDRFFSVGETWLFVPIQIDRLGAGVVVDGACSSTTPWTDDLARLRPADAHPPTAAPTGTSGGANPLAFLSGVSEPVLTALIVGGGAFILALLVSRRRDA